MKHFVYRAYDQRERLLYVGCTVDVTKRFYDHKKKSEWFPYMARHTEEEHLTEEAGLAAEKAAIVSEAPIYNVTHSAPPPPGMKFLVRTGQADVAEGDQVAVAFAPQINDDAFQEALDKGISPRGLYEASEPRLHSIKLMMPPGGSVAALAGFKFTDQQMADFEARGISALNI